MLKIKIQSKSVFVVALFLVLFLTIGIVSANDVSNDDKDNIYEDNIQTTSSNVDVRENIQGFENEDFDNAATGTSNSGNGKKVKDSNEVYNFSSLNEKINSEDSEIVLDHDYTFDKNTDSRFIDLGGILIDRDLTIDGKGHTINCNGQVRFLNVISHNLILKNIKIVNGYSDQIGGAIYIKGYGNFTGCLFDGSQSLNGGAIYVTHGDCEFKNCNFTYNNVTGEAGAGHGGAIYFDECSGTFVGCSFSDNSATEYYGGVYIHHGVGNFTGCSFSNNVAPMFAGAVGIGGTGSFTSCTFSDNSCPNNEGGAVRVVGNGTFVDCSFSDNSAKREGGAVSMIGYGNFTGCSFTGNHGGLGGAVFANETSAIFENCNFTGNYVDNADGPAYGNGGAVSVLDCDASFVNCIFSANNATRNGGSVFVINVFGNFSGCLFTGGQAYCGGAVYVTNKNSVFENCEFSNNIGTDGGALTFNMCNITCINLILTHNNATTSGGAIFCSIESEHNVSIINSLCEYNYAYHGGAFAGNGYFENSSFNHNNADWGGAIDGYGTFINSTFLDNTANNAGAVGGYGIFIDSKFIGNKADNKGGAVFVEGIEDSNITFIKSLFKENQAMFGAAIYTHMEYDMNCINSTFTNNNLYRNGGTVFIDTDEYRLHYTANFTHCTFKDNFGNIVYRTASHVDSIKIDNLTKLLSDIDLLGEYTEISVTIYNHYIYGSNNTILCNVSCADNRTDLIGGIVYTIIDNKCYLGYIQYNMANILFNDVTPGNYMIHIIYNGTNNFAKSIFSANATINYKDVCMNVSANNSTYEEYELINVIFNETVKGSVYLIYNNTTYSTDINGNNGTIIVPGLIPGNYSFDIYLNSPYYNVSMQKVNFTVFKKNLIMDVSAINIIYGEDEVISVKFNEDIDGVVNLRYNNHNFTANIIKGNGSFILPMLNAGNYSFDVKFHETELYNSTHQCVNFNVMKYRSKIIANDATYIINYGEQYYAITNINSPGHKINFILNGYDIGSVLTDESGVAKIAISPSLMKKVGAGRCSIIVFFAGDENYDESQTHAKIIINKENIKFYNVKSVKNKYKLTANTMQLTATLKNSKNKAIKNKYVYFKVNNKKSYLVKTNSKGVAKLTLNKKQIKLCGITKKGVYKFSVICKPTATDKSATGKGTLKVCK